ncbi:MAG: hypothetical protein E7Z91_00060 [Cyanobacteria bacterium SIG30]|nr:hypothetical protein [Cyanobacteria bacterium SIG30]
MANVEVKATIDLKKYENSAKEAIADIKARAGKDGQFLNWIEWLLNNQIENIDNLYALAQKAKEDGAEELAILGIGGSRHTTEAMVKMLGIDSNVHFYSSVDPVSFKRFADKLNLDKTTFLVVSKSGGTLETTTAFENAKTLLKDYYKKDDVSEKFIAMTDKNPEKSALRREVNAGAVKASGFVHDDVGGRFSIFDDATIFTLAFVGVKKEDVVAMLNSALNAQKDYLSEDIEKNSALKLALFNVDAKLNGKNKHFSEYFGDAFEGATLWEKQMKNESLKASISTDTNVGPGYLHYNAEADLDLANNDSFYTFTNVATDDKVTNAVLTGVKAAYSNQHRVAEIILEDLTPVTVGRFIELKHLETLLTGNILRRENGNITDKNVALPEVLQPNVEIYKKEVKKALL